MSAEALRVFGINEQITGPEVDQILQQYKQQFDNLNGVYSDYFHNAKKVVSKVKLTQRAEKLLSLRYVVGLAVDKILMSKQDIETMDRGYEIVPDINRRKLGTSNPNSTKVISYAEEDKTLGNKNFGKMVNLTPEQRANYGEMYTTSMLAAQEYRRKIANAQREYMKSTTNPKDFSKMLDVLVELRYQERILELAAYVAKTLDASNTKYSEETFFTILTQSEPYLQLQELYKRVATKENRDIVDYRQKYVMDNMSDTTQIKVVSQDRISEIVNREKQYAKLHVAERARARIEPEYGTQAEVAVNQRHDYSWGIVLQRPRVLLSNEPVNTPDFKGHITVEKLGSFTSESLFKKKKYQYEVEKEIAQKGKVKKDDFGSRLSMIKDRILGTPDSPKTKTMRYYFYRQEATKKFLDNILRVTKVDERGITKTRIIISPEEYIGIERPQYKEFFKNIYLSDYMLDIAENNGGYAGKIEQNDAGFFVTNKYNDDEMSSAIQFANGGKGNILDCRDMIDRSRYLDVTKLKFDSLLINREREKNFNE